MSVRDGPFHPLRIEAAPCDPAVVQEHLSGFIRRFVRADRRERAEHIVFRLAPKDADRLKELQHMLDERYTSPPRELQLPSDLPDVGVYYAGGDDGWLMQRADAEVASGYLCRDAIWSAISGTYAVFLHHEWSHWVCFRKPETA